MSEDDDRSNPQPQVVKSYAAGMATRSAARLEQKQNSPSVFPNLAQAAVAHRADSGPQTLQQHAEAQRQDGPSESQQRSILRPETIEGLKALHEAQEAHRKTQAAQQPEPPKPEPEKTEEEPAEEDDEFVEALRGAKRDVIQNEAERKAVAKRVKEIDLADGLVTGEFTQEVPIVPDKLTVTYRCLTAGENSELRLLLIEQLEKDGRRGHAAEDLLGFYQVVASVVSLNKSHYARHMTAEGSNTRLQFQREIFLEKVHAFMNFPMPLISALSAHGAWFDQRVRELFATTDRIKNG